MTHRLEATGSATAGHRLPTPGPGSDREAPPTGGTGFFSVLDSHELNQTELENSNLVLGAEGFVYIPVFGEGPLAGEIQGYELAPKWLQDEVLGTGDDAATGRTGPTAAELAIDRSRVQATNLSTFIQATISELSNEIDARRLSTEQALGEFNKRLDAFREGGAQFLGIQPYTITPGSQYLPGREPGGVGERLGRPVLEASPVMFDPFAMADQILADSPSLTDIGVPSGAGLDEAVEIAREFLGG